MCNTRDGSNAVGGGATAASSRANTLLLVCVYLAGHCVSFGCCYVLHHLPPVQRFSRSSIQTHKLFRSPSASSLLEAVCAVGIRAKLRKQDFVGVRVMADVAELLRGQVQGVQIHGKGWESHLGLRCRSILFSLGQVKVNMPALLAERALVLHSAARGNSVVVFDALDFASFLVHPLVTRAPIGTESGEATAFTFCKGCEIDLAKQHLTFSGFYRTAQRQATLRLDRSNVEGISVHIAATRGESAEEEAERQTLARGLERFFNSLIVDLDGVELRYNSMKLLTHAREPAIELSLGVVVRKAPFFFVNF